MSGWNDILAAAQPALAILQLQAVAGRTWSWTVFVSDAAGVALPWTTLGTTATAKLFNSAGVEQFPGMLTVAVGNDGSVVISATNLATANVTPGSYLLQVALVTGGQSVDLCNATGSTLGVMGF